MSQGELVERGVIEGGLEPRVRLGQCLVTGGCGYTGRSLARALAARGCRVRVLDIVDPSEAIEGVEYLRGSLCEPDTLRGACEGVDTVFSVAAVINLDSLQWARPEARALAEEVNVEGPRRLVEMCRGLGIRRLVHTSSNAVTFKGVEEDADESADYTPAPGDVYSDTKQRAEKLVLAANGPDLSTCALRPGIIYGPGEGHHLPRLVREVVSGRFVATVGDSSARSDCSFIDSLVQAHIRAAEQLHPDSPVAGKAYFINDGTPMNYFEFFRPLVEGMGERMPRLRLPLGLMAALAWCMEASRALIGIPAKPFLNRYEVLKTGVSHYYRIDRARAELGYEPLVDTHEGLRRTLPYCRALHASMEPVERPPLRVWLAVLAGMFALGMIACHDATWQLWSGHVVSIVPWAVYQWTFVVAMALHLGEGIYAWSLARRTGRALTATGWGIQTFLLGIFSLRLLLARTRGVGPVGAT